VLVHFVDIGGIVGHFNLRVLFKAIQKLSIDKYNLSLEKGTNIKKTTTPHKQQMYVQQRNKTNRT
jgi:hypothetical protein